MFIMAFVHIVSAQAVKHIFQEHSSYRQLYLFKEISIIELGRRIQKIIKIALVRVEVILYFVSFFFVPEEELVKK